MNSKKILTQDYKKLKLVLKTHLRTKGYFKALKAMELAQKFHTNTRKDGQPEFSHQVSQACLFMTLEVYALYPEEVYVTIFLHDTPEDYDLSIEDVERDFGEKTAQSVKLMCKIHPDLFDKLSNKIYYSRMHNNAITSICKGFDRIHNLMTMLGAFKPEKQLEYVQETIDFVLPMLKKARNKFPEQYFIYENIKFILHNQIGLYQEINRKK